MKHLISVVTCAVLAGGQVFAREQQSHPTRLSSQAFTNFLVAPMTQIHLSLRPLLAALVATQGISQQDFSEALAFAKQHHVNLDRPIRVKIRGHQAYLDGKKLDWDPHHGAIVYMGLELPAENGVPFAVLIERNYQKLMSKNKVGALDPWHQLFVPLLFAETQAEAMAERALTLSALAMAETGFPLAGQGGGLLLGSYFVQARALHLIHDAFGAEVLNFAAPSTCDRKGLSLSLSGGKTITITASNGKVDVRNAGEEVPIPNNIRDFKERAGLLLTSCAGFPVAFDPQQLTRGFRAIQSRASPTSEPATASPSATSTPQQQ